MSCGGGKDQACTVLDVDCGGPAQRALITPLGGVQL